MPLPLPRALFLVLLVLASITASATHNRAGEIVVEQIGDGSQLTVRATIITYTAFEGNSEDADRDSLLIDWGDGERQDIVRDNGPVSEGFPNGERIGNNLKRNTYTAIHTYSGRGTYVIGMQDPNRIENIRNINGGNSVNTIFYIRTVFTFLDPTFQGPNSTPRLLQPPIDQGCVGQIFIHNPNAFDPDGDSLSYQLGTPLAREGVEVSNYRFPNEFGSSNQNDFRLDPVSGTLTWDRPRESGNYNAVILVISYRNGIPIDTTTRDMQIFIDTCDNEPPRVEVDNEYCLVAGQSVVLNPIATAPIEENQEVRLDVFSSTLNLDIQPATWTGDTLFHPQPWTSEYSWRTVCEHADRYPYRVIFRAEDDFGAQVIGGKGNLSTLEVVDIKVSAPPPLGLRVSSESNIVDISWDSPYACEVTQDSFFYGFSVWRREGSNPFPFDSCRQGLAGQGYTRIATQIGADSIVEDRYTYTDEEVEAGRTYCYRIVANFVRYTASGRPFNLVESIPSEEVCVQSSRVLPLLTRVDVLETSETDGRIDVRWIAPLAEDLDTAANPAPYTYQVLRSPGVGTSDFSPIAGTERTFDSFAALQRDSMYVDEGLNTVAGGFTYAIAFTSRGDDGGTPPLPSSSVFLTAVGADRINELSWFPSTSWENTRYDVLRERADGAYDTLATVNTPVYTDRELENGQEYCYLIVAYGTYGVPTIYSPLVNRSQRTCAVPRDVIPPCAPDVSVQTICDELGEENVAPPYETTVSFSFDGDCSRAADLGGIRVYSLADSTGEQRTLVGETNPQDSSVQIVNEFDIAACYALTAVDTSGNESELSELICVSNCPFYELPNAITPNGDGSNDALIPRVSRFVERVNFQLFDRWGVKVYETNDPQLGWEATTLTGKPVTDGTYFYTCDLFQRLSDGSVQLVGQPQLSGYVEVFTGNE